MKVADLRKILNNTNDVVLKNAFVEVYKLVPASKKKMLMKLSQMF